MHPSSCFWAHPLNIVHASHLTRSQVRQVKAISPLGKHIKWCLKLITTVVLRGKQSWVEWKTQAKKAKEGIRCAPATLMEIDVSDQASNNETWQTNQSVYDTDWQITVIRCKSPSGQSEIFHLASEFPVPLSQVGSRLLAWLPVAITAQIEGHCPPSLHPQTDKNGSAGVFTADFHSSVTSHRTPLGKNGHLATSVFLMH